jgi:hypothetical protein
MNSNDDDFFEINQQWQVCYRDQESFNKQPVLFLLLTFYADKFGWSEQQMASCCQQQTEVILQAIKVPMTDANLKALTVSGADQAGLYTRHELSALYQFFQLDRVCRLPENIFPDEITQLVYLAVVLGECPNLVTARFIKRGRQGSRLARCLSKVDSIYQLAKKLNMDANIDTKIRRCRHHRDLYFLQAKLKQAASDVIVENLGTVDLNDLDAVLSSVVSHLDELDREELKAYWFDNYEPLPTPLQGTADIVGLCCFQQLFLETHVQHNCTVSFHHEILDQQVAFFRVLTPERATLCLRYNVRKQRYKIDQLLLKDNQPVSAKTRRAVKRWLKQAQR